MDFVRTGNRIVEEQKKTRTRRDLEERLKSKKRKTLTVGVTTNIWKICFGAKQMLQSAD